MNSLDFLSGAPNIFIFNKERYKTNFGGVLFLIYIIIMILISLPYILDYALNEKYTYESINCFNKTNDKEKIILNEDEELNPYLEVTISLSNDNFSLLIDEEDKSIEKECDNYGGSIYRMKEKSDSINVIITFFCGEDKNCTLFNKYMELNKGKRFGFIDLDYPGYKIEHLNDIPIYEDKARKISTPFYLEDNNKFFVYYYDWEVVKYKDQKSLFDTFTNRKTEYTFGHLKNDEPRIETEYYNIKDIDDGYYFEGKGYFLPLIRIMFSNNHDEYILYKRKKNRIIRCTC